MQFANCSGSQWLGLPVCSAHMDWPNKRWPGCNNGKEGGGLKFYIMAREEWNRLLAVRKCVSFRAGDVDHICLGLWNSYDKYWHGAPSHYNWWWLQRLMTVSFYTTLGCGPGILIQHVNSLPLMEQCGTCESPIEAFLTQSLGDRLGALNERTMTWLTSSLCQNIPVFLRWGCQSPRKRLI